MRLGWPSDWVTTGLLSGQRREDSLITARSLAICVLSDGEVRRSGGFRSGWSGRLGDQRQSGECRAGTFRHV